MKVRDYDFTKAFAKIFKKLKGKELQNVKKKIQQILTIEDLNHYKNLKYELSKYKRVHVNKHFVIIFYDTSQSELLSTLGIYDSLKTNNKIIFISYSHHEDVYEK